MEWLTNYDVRITAAVVDGAGHEFVAQQKPTYDTEIVEYASVEGVRKPINRWDVYGEKQSCIALQIIGRNLRIWTGTRDNNVGGTPMRYGVYDIPNICTAFGTGRQPILPTPAPAVTFVMDSDARTQANQAKARADTAYEIADKARDRLADLGVDVKAARDLAAQANDAIASHAGMDAWLWSSPKAVDWIFHQIATNDALVEKLRQRLGSPTQPQPGAPLYAITSPLLGAPRATPAQCGKYILGRPHGEYTATEVSSVVAAYFRVADSVGLDAVILIAQMIHETGAMSSWWAARPRRNPAGIGVTGLKQPGTPSEARGPSWAYDEGDKVWRFGVSFNDWVADSIPAHAGRLLAYALTNTQANEPQRALIARALAIRPLAVNFRGAAPTLAGLNARWAEGTEYATALAKIANEIRQI